MVAIDGKQFSTAAWQEWYGDKEAKRLRQFGQVRRPRLRRRRGRDRRRPGRAWPGRERPRSACATGASRASATGAPRSR
ncbi:hypothetical protein LP420_23765 [Massilia sp. B-10]|nr:hypothetical protein LP420_23765 [Massilia sp. B-10]